MLPSVPGDAAELTVETGLWAGPKKEGEAEVTALGKLRFKFSVGNDLQVKS